MAGLLATAGLSLLGKIFFAGFAAAIVIEEREGEHHSMGDLVRSLPFGRLIGADLVYVLLVVGGFCCSSCRGSLRRRGSRSSLPR